MIAWREALSDLSVEAIKIGAVETIRKHKDFMPTPAQFRGYMEDAYTRMGERNRATHEDCELCRGTGWQIVSREDGQGQCAKRCEGPGVGNAVD